MPAVKGYRELTESELELINSIKTVEQGVAELWHKVRALPSSDQRQLGITRTELEHAFMRFVRAVARPESPWEG